MSYDRISEGVERSLHASVYCLPIYSQLCSCTKKLGSQWHCANSESSLNNRFVGS